MGAGGAGPSAIAVVATVQGVRSASVQQVGAR